VPVEKRDVIQESGRGRALKILGGRNHQGVIRSWRLLYLDQICLCRAPKELPSDFQKKKKGPGLLIHPLGALNVNGGSENERNLVLKSQGRKRGGM